MSIVFDAIHFQIDACTPVSGWMLAAAERSKIAGAESLTDAELANEHRVRRFTEAYIETMLTR